MVLVAALLTVGSARAAPASVTEHAAAVTATGPGGSTLFGNVKYCPGIDPTGASDVMDIYTPAGAVAGDHFPVFVFVHGGGWETGNNLNAGAKLGADGYSLEVATALLATKGWVVASVDYRLADHSTNPPGQQFPDQIIDVKCALRFLRANAGTYDVDGSHIIAMGSSAGGHLVSLAGTAPPSAGFECQSGDTTDWCGQSSAVQAVVDEWGVSDFTDSTWGLHASQVIQQVFGHAPGVDNPVLERASPVSYIATGDPPFLIIQGDEDPLNTPTQAPELAQRLTLAGVPNTIYMVHHAAHGVLEPGEQPGITQLVQIVTSFVESEG
jgi:acetyl esterase/lipase